MVKDYFQDITPPSDGPRPEPAPLPRTPQPSAARETPNDTDEAQEVPIHVGESVPPARGIRSISAPSRPRPISRPGLMGADIREAPPPMGSEPPKPRRSSRLWIWVVAVLSILILSAIVLILAIRSTTITVTPKSHALTLTETVPFTAYPSGTSAAGALSYTIQVFDLEDSEVVPSEGTTHVENKASGSITVFNNYSASPVRLVKTTRFETPEGLIFRVPADVMIPGKNASGPGEISVTVVADQAGEKYNVGPVSRFTLPGLKSGDMYTQVYAKSASAMSGGFAGEMPGTAPGALNTAIAAVRGRLEAKARESTLAESTPETIVLPGLMRITYQSQPHTTEAGGGVRIHEKARVEVPVFLAETFAGIVAQAMTVGSDNASVYLVTGSDFTAHMKPTDTPALGVDAINFSLSGAANIVWNIDEAALREALAGRESEAFQAIVKGFPSIQEAHARIEPFWKGTFPKDAGDIKVKIAEPEAPAKI